MKKKNFAKKDGFCEYGEICIFAMEKGGLLDIQDSVVICGKHLKDLTSKLATAERIAREKTVSFQVATEELESSVKKRNELGRQVAELKPTVEILSRRIESAENFIEIKNMDIKVLITDKKVLEKTIEIQKNRIIERESELESAKKTINYFIHLYSIMSLTIAVCIGFILVLKTLIK